MKFSRIPGLLVLALLVAPFAFADGGTQVNMVFTGVNGVNDGSYYVSPYAGTMNGQAVVLFCDDIKNEIYQGETWTANVTNLGTALTTNGFSNTRYGGVAGSPVYANAAVAYEEAAWLVTQFATHTNDYISLQYALWDVMNPGSEPTTYGNVAWWLGEAAANYSTINPNAFQIITNTGTLALTGQQQEFLVQTPEPATIALLFSGMLALALLALARARQAA